MRIWIITDTHFDHKQMVQYCGRPENFTQKIKDNLLALVSPNDLLVHLGDVCIGNDKENNEWFKYIGCRTILVKGNHDKKSHEWYIQHGWDLCVDRFDLEMFGKKIAFTHMPVGWDGYFDMNIHGHFHNVNFRRYEEDLKKTLNGYHKLIALEYTNLQPVLLSNFIK